MATKLARIRPRGLNESGIPDGTFYSTMIGCHDRDGYLQFAQQDGAGFTGSPSVINTPLWGMWAREPDVIQTTTQRDYYFMLGHTGTSTNAEITVSQGSTAKAISPATGGEAIVANQITGGTLNGQPYFNFPGRNPFTWAWDFTTPTAVAALTGWFASTDCRALRGYRDFLVAMDIYDGSNRFNTELRWSDRAASGGLPTAWTATATNEAGSATAGDSPGEIIDGAVLGDIFIIYKGEGSYRMEEIGLPQVMGIRRGLASEGVMGRNCVQTIDGLHYVVGNQDIYKTDGRSAQSIISRDMRKFFFDDLQDDDRDHVYTAYNPQYNEFWVCYMSNEGAAASKDYPDKAMVYNGEHWSFRRLGEADESPGDGDEGYPHIFLGLWPGSALTAPDSRLLGIDPAATNDTFYMSRVDDDDETIRPLTAEVHGIELSPGKRSIITRIRPILFVGAAANFTLGAADFPGGTPSWGSAQAFSQASDDWLTLRQEGRYHSIRIEEHASGSSSKRMSIVGFDIEYEETGRD